MEINSKPSKQAIKDSKIISEVLNGRSNAFQKLMDRYYDIIYYTLMKMVYNKTDAEELTLEVFSKAYQNLNKYDNKYAFSTWIFRIATNTGIDYIRKKRTNTVIIEDENNDDYESVTLSSDSQQQPDSLLIKQQLAVELRELVEGLKPFWKELIEMRYYKELSYEEIAELLDMPLGTVKSQLYRAKRQLSGMAEAKLLEDFDHE